MKIKKDHDLLSGTDIRKTFSVFRINDQYTFYI